MADLPGLTTQERRRRGGARRRRPRQRPAIPGRPTRMRESASVRAVRHRRIK
ncbi:hypothetical protein V5F01_03150 [Streptomyces sp. NRRL B-2790]|uniref:hypothetical protein n=1 Tax=Streptomyces sp. NRRL B-2790 TaxID=1463835 RepID=UPI000AFCEE31